jgi:methyl-accepting chemotaxis protein
VRILFLSKLKISTKLVISSAVFLIPIGVLLSFIIATAAGTIQKTMNEYDGINALKPAITVHQKLPEYLNAYLGLQNGDLRRLEDELNNAVRTIDREMQRYTIEDRHVPVLAENWEKIRRFDSEDENIYQEYLDFSLSVYGLMSLVGEYSSLKLVSDMDTYYLVNPSLSDIPEVSTRAMAVGNILRHSLQEAESVVLRWNENLAESQASGRRLSQTPFAKDPKTITMNMVTDFQTVRNSRSVFDTDRERITSSLMSIMAKRGKVKHSFDELAKKLERFQDSVGAVSEQSGARTFGSLEVAEFLGSISLLNTDACQLWTETLNQLEVQIRMNTRAAWGRIIMYLVIVLVSLGIAIGFVAFITRDINKSVRLIKTLFKGLKENDLTMLLQVQSEDEFGELMTSFNSFLKVLRSTFGSFKQSASLVSNSVFDLSSSSKEITTTANEQSASVSEIVSTMEGSKNLSEQIALKTTEVAQLAKETQELSSKGAELREANQVMMEDIRNQNQKIISEIRSLSDMIVRISEAIRIIDGIADQTKLIAFNASLEASSSGEAGARFSVVASEIRRFADNVVESTKEIKQKIEEVQGASQTLITEANSGSRQIEIGYERMSEQKAVFESIVGNSQNVAVSSQQISNLSKQQELASSQIFTALKEISAGVKQFVIATSSTSKIADSLNGMSEELKGKVEKYRTEN